MQKRLKNVCGCSPLHALCRTRDINKTIRRLLRMELRVFSCALLCGLCVQKGLKNVFDEAILAALEPPEPPKKKRCVVL